jgi:hypothetical protein
MNREPTLSDDRLNRGRERLMLEIARQQVVPLKRRRRGLVAGLAGAAVAAALVVAVSVPRSSDDGPAGLRIERISNDTVAVRVVDTTVEARTMSRELQRQGLDVTIDMLPASPQLVGVWLTESFSGDVPEALAQSVIAQVQGYSDTVELPTSFRGEIRFGVGRAPRPGEEVQVSGTGRNALAPGAWLACLHGSGGHPQAVRAGAEALGYTVEWADGDRTATPQLINAPLPGQLVAVATIDDATPSVVRLVLGTPGARRYDYRVRTGYSSRQWWHPPVDAGPCVSPSSSPSGP